MLERKQEDFIMTKKISQKFLCESIISNIGYPTSCSYNKGEDLYILRVFMVPNDKKKEIEDKVYDTIDYLKNNGWNIFAAVLVFTEEKTRKYYPDKVPKASIAPNLILTQAAQ